MSRPLNNQLLIIGYGNEWRGDDGVGPAVAAQIAAMELANVRVMSVHQLTPELAEPTSRATRAVFIDASCERGSGVTMSRLTADPAAEWTTHVVTPEALLAIAKLLYGKAPPAWLIAIEGHRFEIGEELSDFTRSLIGPATRQILPLLAAEPITEICHE